MADTMSDQPAAATVDAPAADTAAMDTTESNAVAASSSSSSQPAATDAGASSSERKEKKKKHKEHKKDKHKKHKKHKKKHKEEKAASSSAPADGEEAAGDAEDEEEEEESESSSSSESDVEDEEAELRDADEEARRRARRERRRLKKLKGKPEKKKKKKVREPGSRFIDADVEVSSDEEVSEDEDEEEEEGQGFIKDLVVPDEEIETYVKPDRKRKRGRRIQDEELDEEDFNLMRENLGMAVHSNDIDKDVTRESDDEEENGRDTKRSRLRKGAVDKQIDFEELQRQKQEQEQLQRQRRLRGDAIIDEMGLDDDDGFLAPEDPMVDTKRKQKHERNDEEKMNDFIEDDTKFASSHNVTGGGEFSSKQKERLREIFGSDLTSFFQTKRGTRAGDDDSDGAYGEDGGEPAGDESSAESETEREVQLKRKAKAAAAAQKPTALRHREQRMNEIRQTDIPERLQQRHRKRNDLLSGMDRQQEDEERTMEAFWIFHQMFRQPLSLTQAHMQRQDDKLVPTITTVLRYIQSDHLEVNFIATYRREHWCGSMLPPDSRLTEEDLMKIDELDEKWIELGSRRKKLKDLLSEYESNAHIRELHQSDQNRLQRGWLDYAVPTSSALSEWQRLLSAQELTGSLELDDLQDQLTVLAAIESCKRRQVIQQRRDQRDFSRKQREEQRAAAARERAEAAARRAEEMAKRRAERENSFEAGMAAAELEEEKVPDEMPIDEDKPEEEEKIDEDVEMQDAAAAVLPRGKSGRAHKFHPLAKAWAITGTPQLAAALGLSPSELGENLSYNYATHPPRDQPWNVDYLAEEAIRHQKVKSVDEALACARRYAAFLISTDPLVRRHVRKEFLQTGEIWTFPTPKGIREIDETHEYYSVKRLVQKPLYRMSEHPAQFLLIHQAEQDGFIRVEFRLPRNTDAVNRVASLAMENAEADTITANLCALYLSANTTPDARKWNEERRLVIHDAMATFLMPLCHTYTRNILLKHAMEFVSVQISKKLMTTLSVSGFQPPITAPTNEDDDESSSSSKKKKKKDKFSSENQNWRIFSIIVGDQFTPSSIAVLNRYGGVIDHLTLHFLKSNAQARGRNGEAQSESERNQYARKKEDTRKLIEFIETHAPKLIVVDASSMDARTFKEELQTKTLVDYPQIKVEFMDPELSRIYMNSARAELEFKEYPRSLRQAISMGRQALDPISEYAGLYSGPIDAEQWSESANTSAQLMHAIQSGRNEDETLKKDTVAAATNALTNDFLALSLHPLQRRIPTRLLLSTMQRVLVRMVNYVGVDINKIVQRPWLTGSLQFLSGLGPIKAKYLLDYVKKHGYLAGRDELLNKTLADGALVKTESNPEAQPTPAAASSSKTDTALFGPCVYRNVAGFLLIRRNAAMESVEEESHPLDETRIHPEHYPFAQQIARDALEIKEDSIEPEALKLLAKEKKKKRREEGDDDDLIDDVTGEIDEDKRNARDAANHAEQLKAAIVRVTNKHIRLVMEKEHARQLIDLDLDAADRQQREDPNGNGESTLETNQQIVSELMEPFADVKHWFIPFSSPSASRLFYLFTGETSRTLREGMLIPVVINGIHPQGKGAYVRLDSGIRGFLGLRNVSDNAPQQLRREESDQMAMQQEVETNLSWIKARLQPGLNVTARIIKIDKERFQIDLSTRSSELNQAQWDANSDLRKQKQQEQAIKFNKPLVEEVDEIEQALYFPDPYLYKGTHPDDAGVLQAEAGPQRAEKRFRHRHITHTLFRNVSREEAIAELKDKAIGEVIVRPSSIGTNHLTLTWKVSDQEYYSHYDPNLPPDQIPPPEKGVYFHVDIREEQKPNEMEIGTKLIVKDDKYVYEDLDEIVARFVNPMVRFVTELVAHKNFRFGTEPEIHGILIAEKQQDRNKFPYALHFATRKEKAGSFQFSFLPNADIRSSSFFIVPEGYLYRDRTYNSVNSLLGAIKTEMSKKVGVAPPAGSSQAMKAGSLSSKSAPKSASLPPYAAAAPPASAAARPPYAGAPQAAQRPPPSSLPPYAGAAPVSMPPYAGANAGAPMRPPYGAPPQNMPPYAGASQGGYPQQPPQQQRPYQPQPPYQQPPQHQPYPHQPPQQHPQHSYQPYSGPPPQQYPQRPPPPQQQQQYAPMQYQQQPPQMQQQQQQYRPPQQQMPMPMPPQPQQPQPAAGSATSGFVHPSRMGIVAPSVAQSQQNPPQQQQQPRAGSRWGTTNSRNDDMQM